MNNQPSSTNEPATPSLSPEECKKIQFDVLCFFRNFCKQHNIRYSLYAGTLLGAVRHKGFIPWDDDIDVLVPREDYETLRKHFDEWNPTPHMHLFDFKKDKDFDFSFLKLADERTVQLESRLKKRETGFHIDIFPLDGIPGGRFRAWLHIMACYFFKRCGLAANRNPYRNYRFPLKKKIAQTLFQLATLGASPRFFYRIVDRLATIYKWNASPYAANLVWLDFKGASIQPALIPSKSYQGDSEVLFEGHMFQVMGDAHERLSRNYGDYMTPPPEHMRYSNAHVFGSWWKTPDERTGREPKDSQ